MNANWPAFIEHLKAVKQPIHVITSGSYVSKDLTFTSRHLIDPLLVNKWDEKGVAETARILDYIKGKRGAIMCFSAGPLSKVWIPQCWATNPTNIYLDVGAALDPFTKGPEVKSRFYTDRNHSFAKEACVFQEPFSIIGKSYTWSGKTVTFLANNVLATIWNTGTYKWLTSHTMEASWDSHKHTVTFTKTFESAQSIRHSDGNRAEHQLYKTPFFYKDMPPANILPFPQNIVKIHKQLLYMCVFCKKDYVTMFKMLLFSIRSSTSLESVDIVVLTDKTLESSVKKVAADLYLTIHTMIVDGITTGHQASSAKLKIFEYQPIYSYERVLYLDTDILVQHDLAPLLTMPLEDILYAVKGGPNGIDYLHGSWFFDDKEMMKITEPFNAGAFIFQPTESIYTLFQHTQHHIQCFFDMNLPHPYCYEQPFMNYHFIKANRYNTKALQNHIHLDHPTINTPLIPIKDITMVHYVDKNKMERMSANFTKLFSKSTNTYLVYTCVFYNKDYIQLLRLLLLSIKMYSSLESIDLLVITSKEFESQIQSLAKTLKLSVQTMTLDLTTIFQAACARLSIFDYKEIDHYSKILYVDTDILIKGDLMTLFTLPIEEKLYALESGFTDSINFGVQFFQPPMKTSGLNSGTLLFRNSPILKALFQRIQTHIHTFTQSGSTPPYALDQPFINYHAIKDALYENQRLKPYVSLFEEGTPENEASSIVCHFSFPIGNFAHKFYRMKTYFDKLLPMKADTMIPLDLVNRAYSWNTGFIKFNSTNLQTSWGPGTAKQIDSNRVLVAWNGFSHVLSISSDRQSWFCIRLHDFIFECGTLLDTWTPPLNPVIRTPLCDIMKQYGSDKGGPLHNYTTLYYSLLQAKQQNPLRIFELGLGTNNVTIKSNMGPNGKPGASLRGWAEFFPQARIFGADIDKAILFQEERIQTFYTDQLDRITIKGMWLHKDLQQGFDLIVDDGLHTYDANVCFLENSIHKLNPGGYYIIEDIRNCDVPLFHKRLEGWRQTHPTYTFQLVLLEHSNTNDNTLFVIHRPL
jgi:lipopolysaccharide biosynthesis glycosyltransferase/SAM-dependent methyltransferase